MGVIDDLVNELKSKLTIITVDSRNVTRPGLPIRIQDQIGFKVKIVNASEMVMKNIVTVASQASAVQFTTQVYTEATLNPGAEKVYPEIIGDVVANPNDFWYFGDRIAWLNTTAEADLSTIQFSDIGFAIAQIEGG